MAQSTKQVKVVSASAPVPGQDFETTAFFDADGEPIDLSGGGAQGPEGPEGPQGPKGDPGNDGADGFGTEAQYNDIISRLEALETAAE